MRATRSATKRPAEPPLVATLAAPAGAGASLSARTSAKRRHPFFVASAVTQPRRSLTRGDTGHGSSSDASSDSNSARDGGGGAWMQRAMALPSTAADDGRARRESLSTDSGSSLAAGPSSQALTAKPRKPTHVVRREEKGELEAQIEKLQVELLSLKYRAMFPHLRTSSGADTSLGRDSLNPQSTGEVLRDAIKVQQLSLASVQGLFSEYVRQHKVSPIHMPIRLGRDLAQRKLALHALRDAKIAEGKRFLSERMRGLSRTKAYFEEERFETDEGDFCVLQFDVTPLPKARSVKELFDVLFYFIFNMEIKITEALGSVTVREDDDSGDERISHHRLTSRNLHNVHTEISTVHFSDFDALGPDNMYLGSGTIVADFVDDDELYPYRPSERVRHDVSAVLTITPERRWIRNRFDAHGPDEEEIVVVLTRWMIVKSHRVQFPISDEAQQHMRDNLGSWTTEMLKAVRQKASGGGGVGGV